MKARKGRLLALLVLILACATAGGIWAVAGSHAPARLVGASVPASLTAVWAPGAEVEYLRPRPAGADPLTLQFSTHLSGSTAGVQVLLNGAPVVAANEDGDWKSAGAAVLYRIRGKELQVRPAPPRPWFTGNLWVAVRLNEHESEEVILAGFSSGRPNPYWFVGSEDPYAQLPVEGGTDRKVAVVRRETVLTPSAGNQPPLPLLPGDSVLVLGRTGDQARVSVYPRPSSPARERLQADQLLEGVLALAGPGVEGLVSSADLAELPAPRDARTVLVGRRGEGGTIGLNLFGYPVGSASITWEPEAASIDLSAAEAELLFGWSDLPGRSYWSMYVDATGKQVTWFDRPAHLPEAAWTDKEYQLYRSARTAYVEALASLWSKVRLTAPVEGIKDKLFEQLIQKPASLQDAWVEWGWRSDVYTPGDFAVLLGKWAPLSGPCGACEVAKAGKADQFTAAWQTYIDQYLMSPATTALMKAAQVTSP